MKAPPLVDTLGGADAFDLAVRVNIVPYPAHAAACALEANARAQFPATDRERAAEQAADPGDTLTDRAGVQALSLIHI